MTTQEKIIAAFLAEQLPDFDINNDTDKKMLLLLSETVTLEKQVADEKENFRTVTIEKDSDDTITAHSIKLANIFTGDLDGQVSLIAKAMTLFPIAAIIKLVLGFLSLLSLYNKNKRIDFNRQDAKILLAIYKLIKKDFTEPEVIEQYEKLGFPSLPQVKISQSLVKLSNAKVLRYLGHGRYRREERIRIVNKVA